MQAAGNYSAIVPFLMFGWIPAVLCLFALLPARRAVLIAFIAGWLFLPVARYEIQSLPEYNKASATCLAVLLGTLLFDTERLFRFRPKLIDVAVAVFVLCPVASSLTNGLGLYDGLSSAFANAILWGLPYLIGRLYFNDVRSVCDLALGVFIGGLIYVPFCLWEMRMSPQLHSMLYGFVAYSGFTTVWRLGGWRPVVFMRSGLMLSMWMVSASLCGFWLWQTRSVKDILGVPTRFLVPVLLATTVLCRSSGAIVLLAFGLIALLATKHLRSALPIMALALIPIVYLGIRAPGFWQAEGLVTLGGRVFGPERAASLQTRIHNEEQLGARARERALFGWGGWGRSRIRDEEGRDISLVDSLWIIVFGTNGTVGLIAFTATILLPVLLLRYRLPPPYWTHPVVASPVAIAVLLEVWMLDNLSNAMLSPVYIAMVGALAGLQKVPLAYPAPRVKIVPPRRAAKTQPTGRALVEQRRLALKSPHRVDAP